MDKFGAFLKDEYLFDQKDYDAPEVMEGLDAREITQTRPQVTALGINTVIDGRGLPYCPVWVEKLEDGTKCYTAYIQDEVKDVDEYVTLIDTLKTAEKDDVYYIYIDSPGGYISSGSIISSAIHHAKCKVYTVARGLCASAACLIHNAAKEGFAKVDDMGVLMIHMSLHSDQGVSTQVKQRAEDQVRYVYENLLLTAKERGYIYQPELDVIQNGDCIYISANDFAQRLEAKESGTEAPLLIKPSDTLGLESWDFAQESFNNTGYGKDNLGYIFGHEKDEQKLLAGRTSELMDPLLDASKMDVGVMIAQARAIKANALRIRTNDGKNFRIYIPSDLVFTRSFIANLCRFLDVRKEDETVTFVLGAKLIDATAIHLGAVISAMKRCRANIRTEAAGFMSIPETMIWCFGKERVIQRYGAMTFGITDIIRHIEKYMDYYKVFLRRAVEIGVLKKEDAEDILKTGMTKFYMYQDFKDREDILDK